MKRNTDFRTENRSNQFTLSLNDSFRAGLSLMLRAYLYALDAKTDVWDFALNVEYLYKAGLGVSDLRWLVAKQIVMHGKETSRYGDRHRSFQTSNGFSFENASCLVLTPKGFELVKRMGDKADVPYTRTSSIDAANLFGSRVSESKSRTARMFYDHKPTEVLRPNWDSTRRELRLGEQIVKRFRVPAKNQEMILCVFEEEGWPKHIDDPLPIIDDIDPHMRLHNTINRLNGRQSVSLLRFRGNGHGTGILWSFNQPNADTLH